jgi:membrane protease YdiL (CAAX protease family)
MSREWVRQNSILSYILLAYGITWMIALPLVLSYHGLIAIEVPFALHYILPFGPLLSALIVTLVVRGSDGFREILSRMSKWKVKPIWFLIALFSVWILYLVSGAIVVSMGQPWPDLSLFGDVLYLPYLTFAGAWLLWVFTFGIGEETGWRGFLLPRLQVKHGPIIASLLVGIFWAGWHVPMFLYNENLIAMGLTGTIFWVIGLMFGSVLLTWLYNSSEGSILMTALWHGTYNLFTAAVGQAAGFTSGIISMFVMIWVVFIVFACRRHDSSIQRILDEDINDQ